jgi:hypothetical protein
MEMFFPYEVISRLKRFHSITKADLPEYDEYMLQGLGIIDRHHEDSVWGGAVSYSWIPQARIAPPALSDCRTFRKVPHLCPHLGAAHCPALCSSRC